MKKLVSVLLAVLMLLSLAACGKKNMKEQLVGSWYRTEGFNALTLSLYSDGAGDMRRSGTDEVIALDWRVVDDTRLELTSTEGYELVFIIEAFDEDKVMSRRTNWQQMNVVVKVILTVVVGYVVGAFYLLYLILKLLGFLEV